MPWRYVVPATLGISIFAAAMVGRFVNEQRAANSFVSWLADDIARKIEAATSEGDDPVRISSPPTTASAYAPTANTKPAISPLRDSLGGARQRPNHDADGEDAGGAPSDAISLEKRFGEPAVPARSIDPEEVAIAAQARNASVIIEADKSFDYGETYPVRLILSRSADVVRKYAEKTKEPTADHFMTAVSRQVRATISAPKTAIAAKSPETQSVRANEATTWLWELTPTASGPTILEITLLQTIIIDGEAFQFPARYFPYEIEVSYSWAYVTQSLFSGLWTTFSAAVASLSALASVATFALTSRLKRTSETQSK